MSSVPSIKIEPLNLERIAFELDAQPGRIAIAARRAIRKSTEWANKEAIHRLSNVLGLRVHIMQGRIRMSIRTDSGVVWIGLNKIRASKHKPQQNASGVEADGMKFRGAFIVKKVNEKTVKYWEEHGEEHMKKLKKSGRISGKFIKKLEGKVMQRRAKKRLRIDVTAFDIGGEGCEEIERLAAGIEEIFLAEFQKQL